jgi:hypothetical protein
LKGTALTTVKRVVVRPMPRASEPMAMSAKADRRHFALA